MESNFMSLWMFERCRVRPLPKLQAVSPTSPACLSISKHRNVVFVGHLECVRKGNCLMLPVLTISLALFLHRNTKYEQICGRESIWNNSCLLKHNKRYHVWRSCCVSLSWRGKRNLREQDTEAVQLALAPQLYSTFIPLTPAVNSHLHHKFTIIQISLRNKCQISNNNFACTFTSNSDMLRCMSSLNASSTPDIRSSACFERSKTYFPFLYCLTNRQWSRGSRVQHPVLRSPVSGNNLESEASSAFRTLHRERISGGSQLTQSETHVHKHNQTLSNQTSHEPQSK